MATKKDIQVCFNPHFDSVSLWIGSFGGADSPCDISRGVFAARQGVPRILEMMDRYGIKTTWDITGHSIESFPKESELIVKYGHELGVHGYTHENPLAMSRQQEADVLDKCIELVTDLCGVRPVGYVAPWWELSPTPSTCCSIAVSSMTAASWKTTTRHTTCAVAIAGPRSTTPRKPRPG